MLLFAAIWTRIAAGRLFHAIGPAAENPRLCMDDDRQRGTMRQYWSADRKCWRSTTVETGTQSSIGSIAVGSIRFGSTGVGSIGVGSIGVGSNRVGSIRIWSIRVGSIRIWSIGVGSIRIWSIGVGSIRFGSIGVGSIDRSGSGYVLKSNNILK